MCSKRFGTRAAAGALCLALTGTVVAAQEKGAAPNFSISPTAYVQFDVRAYPDWPVTPGTGRLDRETAEIRRLRAGLEGRWRQFSFEFTVDPFDEDDTYVKDAVVGLRLSRAARVRLGQFKLPGSREYDQSARRTEFLERSVLATHLAAGRDIGASIDGEMGTFDYAVGLFAGDGQGRRERAQLTTAARVGWEPADGLELGAYGTAGRTRAVDEDDANGLDGRSSSGYRFFERLYVDGTRVRLGADVEWTEGPWRVAMEVMRVSDERRQQGVDFEDLPALLTQSWTVTASRRFGAARSSGASAPGATRPARWPWQVALRFEHVSFDDAAASTGRDSVRPRAGDVRPRGLEALTTGLSHDATRWLRIVGDVGVERYAETRSAPNPGRRGNYFTAGLRLQFAIR